MIYVLAVIAFGVFCFVDYLMFDATLQNMSHDEWATRSASDWPRYRFAPGGGIVWFFKMKAKHNKKEAV